MSDRNANKKLAYSISYFILGMLMLAYASVPLYSIFCKLTGFSGTVVTGKYVADRVGTKQIKIRFDANIDKDLPWIFKPEQQEVTVRVGENILVFYYAENLSNEDIIGTAVYNVTPHKAGAYFNKIQCFCFEEQLLKAGQKMPMPVSFFIDPDIETDPATSEVSTITLSYSFYRVKN